MEKRTERTSAPNTALPAPSREAPRSLESLELAKANSLLRATLEATGEGILVIGLDGEITIYNQQFCRMWGLSDARLTGPRMGPCISGQLKDPESFLRKVRELYAAPDSESLDVLELVDGRIIERSSKPQRLGDEIVGRVWCYRDVTERKQSEAAIAHQAAELKHLQELERLKDDFLNAASHELRTPLTSIAGYAEFLEDGIGGALSETQEVFVQQIQQGARRLRRIVDDMLDFARLEAGTFQLVPQEASLSALIHQECASMVPQAMEAHVVLEAPELLDPLILRMDPKRVGQVLLNLLSNAIKFTPTGGRVSLNAEAREGVVRVEVVDTGIGLRPEHLPSVFRKFFQVDPSLTREHSGAGLGLAISKALVEAHGGTIGVLSAEGVGSTFWFTLPTHG